jgi:HEAT repeat protein
MRFEEERKKGKEKGNDPRSTEDLVRLALNERDADQRWDLVAILHWRNTREVLDAALRLCDGPRAKERELGADILAELGVGEQTFYEECIATLLRLLDDKRVSVVESAAYGLYHMHDLSSLLTGHGREDLRVVAPLVKLHTHPSARVRYAVVFGLLTLRDDHAIRALIDLSADKVDRVRDWATFGLGSQLDEVDTPELRDALFRRLEDPHFETCGEALVGLAHRKDPRVTEPLREELLRGDVGILSLEAAAEMADPRLLDALIGLKERWIGDGRGWEDRWDSTLLDAISACSQTVETGPLD